MTAVLRILALIVLTSLAASAESMPAMPKIAMLPLDAGTSLELYGRPVASELSKAIVAAGLVVQVVGARATVSADARLIIDGTIKQGRGETIELAIRIRNPADGRVLDTLAATAPNLANIDRAAADLATRVVPVVQARLEAMAANPGPVPEPSPVVGLPSAPRPPMNRPTLALQVAGAARLEAPLARQAAAWIQDAGHVLMPVDPMKPVRWPTSRGPLLHLEIRAFHVEPGPVPMARARVHVVLSGVGGEPFDRVIVTDTVVGDKGMTPAGLAERVATEVLAILRPHMRRAVPTWP